MDWPEPVADLENQTFGDSHQYRTPFVVSSLNAITRMHDAQVLRSFRNGSILMGAQNNDTTCKWSSACQ